MATSYFSWLAFSEKERRKVLDVVELFGDRDTRDELGIGGIRDAFADLFFPGISTIQTRARYFLFVPWIYLALERRKKSSSEIGQLGRSAEIKLINVLADTEGEKEGVIGYRARSSLKRLPSNIYWQGLGKWGIRQFPGSQDAYHRSIDRFYLHNNRRYRSLEEELADSAFPRTNWHAVPEESEDFPRGATFQLERDEALYLRERIQTAVPDSLLCFLLSDITEWQHGLTEFPWLHPATERLNETHRWQLRHAANFSLIMYGASLLYNLILAESANETSQKNNLREEYELALKTWAVEIENAGQGLLAWSKDRASFWRLVRTVNPRIGMPTQAFVENWVDLVLNSSTPAAVARSDRARNLIREREIALKREQARVRGGRPLELWGGSAGAYPLNYRWGKAQRILLDIVESLQGAEAYAATTR